jgi:predicted peptidase
MRTVKTILILGWIVLMSGMTGCSARPILRSTSHYPGGIGFVKTRFDSAGAQHQMWVFVPKAHQTGKPLPAIVFLHGLFEAGSDCDRAVKAGLGPVIARSPDDWGFITLFPQSNGTWKGPEREALVLDALHHAKSRWSIDSDRVILAGLSYGALGACEIGARHPDKFAAVVGVSGHRPSEPVERLAMIPIWMFAFTGDPVVRARHSRDLIAELQARGSRAQITTFDGVGHDGWVQAVQSTALVDWMKQQRRPRAENFASVADP